MNGIPRIVRNDWSSVPVPELGQWRPQLSVSVVVPAYRCPESLALVLAALHRQTYPPELLEVVVVDDDADGPPLQLPDVRPARTRLLRAADHGPGWGRANALHVGFQHSTGDIVHWLDADMLVYPEHVEAQARWHHLVPYAVTLGYKRFVDVAPGGPGWPTPEAVDAACAAGAAGELFDLAASDPHDYVEELIRRTDQLRGGDHLNFMAHVGATAALRRELYLAAGGLDTTLRLGEDTEFGYRLAQAGAVFVPEPQARSWHLGRTHVMRAREQVQRYNRPHLADRMPQPRWLRRIGGSGWSVPLLTVSLDVTDRPLERVRAAVDALLAGSERDLRVCLVGPWASLTDTRVSPLRDPLLDLRLIAETYRSDPRVELVGQAPDTAFPGPYLAETTDACGLPGHTVRTLIDALDRDQLGLLEVHTKDAQPAVRLWRTAALSRARLLRRPDESLADVVTQLYGAGHVDAAEVGVVDLSRFTVDELAEGIGAAADPALGGGRWLPGTIEVAGVRSLGRAAVLVSRLTLRRAAARLRRTRRDATSTDAAVVTGPAVPGGAAERALKEDC
ncbi:MAG TPA: glycosyltransferase [Actinoplanes sp.]|nr:glycosyltransferase [Actinoplanes sp.]